MFRKDALVFILLTFFSVMSKAQPVDEIIAKYIAYTGGVKEWKKVKTIVSSGIYDYGGIQFPFKTYSKAPDRYKIMVPYKGKYYAQAFDGKQGWKIDAFKNETKKTLLKGKAARAMSNESDPELESPLINYRQKGYEASLESKDTIDGRLCYRVRLLRKEGDPETYFFNSSNYELVRKKAPAKNSELENAMLDIDYSDYRQVDSVRIPFKTVCKSGDQTILTITIKKITLNTPIADGAFKY